MSNDQNTNKCKGEVQVEVSENIKEKSISCSSSKQVFKLEESDELGKMISQIVSSRKGGKAKIKLEIEFSE